MSDEGWLPKALDRLNGFLESWPGVVKISSAKTARTLVIALAELDAPRPRLYLNDFEADGTGGLVLMEWFLEDRWVVSLLVPDATGASLTAEATDVDGHEEAFTFDLRTAGAGGFVGWLRSLT